MHELGVVIQVVKTVEEFALEKGITKIDTVVLQIGELSSMVPRFVENCYPAAIDGRKLFKNSKLEIERLPVNSLCRSCEEVSYQTRSPERCPSCGGRELEILSGREFLIKEIIAN